MEKIETVIVKASIDELGNGTFPSNTNIVTHDGIALYDFINQRVQKTKEGFSLNNNGTVEIDMQNKEWWKITHTGIYYLTNVKDVLENNTGFMIIEALDDLILKYTWKPITSDSIYTITTGLEGVSWKQITETHSGITNLNGWTTNGHEPIVTKIGDVVWFNGILREGTNTKGTKMANIPEGYRPYVAIVVSLITYAGNGLAVIDNKGNITIDAIVPYTGNVQISAMWKVKE